MKFLLEEIIAQLDEEIKTAHGVVLNCDKDPKLYYKYDDVKQILYNMKDFYERVSEKVGSEIIKYIKECMNDVRVEDIEKYLTEINELEQKLEWQKVFGKN